MGRVKMFFTRLGPSLCFAGILIAAILLTPVAGEEDVSKATDREARAKSLYAEGMDAVRRGDLSRAYTSFQEVVKLLPRSPEAHN